MTALERAIKLRQWTRQALAWGDMRDVARLNRQADNAYERLSPDERRAYLDWAFGRGVPARKEG